MTETTTPQTDTIQDLKAAVREAGREERRLAVESDDLPNKIKDAAREEARAKARAAREGGAGAAVAAVEDESDVPSLVQRQKDMPYLLWSQKVKVAALEVQSHEAQIAAAEQRAAEAKTGLIGLKASADEAARIYNERARAYQGAVNSKDSLVGRRAVFVRELRHLEEAMPGA